MTTYNTHNPIGSTDVRDLYDNAQNLDTFSNGQDPVYPDRFGVSRKSLAGMRSDFSQFLLASGFEFIGDYDSPGELTFTRPNQMMSKGSEYWTPGPGLSLPYTTVNNWTIDQPKFVSRGDASLRQALALTSGAGLVGFDPAVSYPAGSVGAQLQLFADQGFISIKTFGAIAGGTGHGATNITALNVAMAAASAIGVASGAPMTVIIPRSSLGPWEFGGILTGTHKVMCPPMPYVEILLQGQIKISDGQNALAGAEGYKFIAYAEDTDPSTSYFTVRGTPGNFIDGNAANNLNTVMKSNALIAVAKGVGCGAYGVNFKNCPGYHVIQWGLNTFPFSIGPVETIGCTFTDVGETIVGNTGITDHSSVYGFTTIRGERCRGQNNGLPATICSMFEAHGLSSVINDNEYNNYLNMVNIGGYASNADTFRITNNRCFNGHMLVRCFTQPGFGISKILIQGNQLNTAVGITAMVDFGVATSQPTVDNVDLIGNQFEFNGADHGIGYPPGAWIANVKNFRSMGNRWTGLLGPALTFGNCPAQAVVVIDSDVIMAPNRSGYANSYAAIYLENVVGKYASFSVKDCTIVNPKTYALATTAFAAIQADVVSFKDNDVVGSANLISIEGTTAITRVDLLHMGPAPLSTFEIGNQWTKISVGSKWICTDTGFTMEKTVAGSTYWNKFGDGFAAPSVGNFQKGDRIRNILPAAGGNGDIVCTTAGSPGTWKIMSTIAA